MNQPTTFAKKIFMFIVLVCSALTCHSQFLNKNAIWTVLLTQSGGIPVQYYDEAYIEKDTFINDTLYSVFYFHSDHSE
jgi:hypothetical protein